MRARSMPRALCLAAIAVVGFLAGCGDDNPTKPANGNNVPAYPTLNSPQNVLEALVMSYSIRDSVEYRKLIDFDYLGTSRDLGDGTNLIFDTNDEVRHIQALAKATTITDISLSMGPSSSWTRLPSDDLGHPEWAVIQISGSQLRLEINDTNPIRGILLVNNPANTYVFRFKPTPPDTTRTDTLWTLIQWSEIANP